MSSRNKVRVSETPDERDARLVQERKDRFAKRNRLRAKISREKRRREHH